MTAPLTPVDCDLRGYEYMPLYGHHLFGSAFDASVSDFGWRIGVTLWWAAWNQVPAASLPNDDVALAKLADLGRDVRSFRKVKTEALRGFVLCDDGRLYHAKLAKWAIEAWDRRVKERARKAAWRAARDADGTVTGTGTERGQERGRRPDNGRDIAGTSPLKGSEGKVREVKGTSKPEVDVTQPSPPQTNGTDSRHPGAEAEQTQGPNRTTIRQQWRDPAWVAATARIVQVERRTGESDTDFADRVSAALDAKRRTDKAEGERRAR